MKGEKWSLRIDWCKLHDLPEDRTARIIYNDSKAKMPTLLKAVQCIFDDKIQEAAEILNVIVKKEIKKYGFEY